MPIHRNKEKQQAKYLYFNTNKTQREIAGLLFITEQTIGKWVREGDWAAQKKAMFHSPMQEIQHLYNEIREINRNIMAREEGKRFATKEEMELKSKIFGLITGPLSSGLTDWREVPVEVSYNDLKSEMQKVLDFDRDFRRAARVNASVNLNHDETILEL